MSDLWIPQNVTDATGQYEQAKEHPVERAADFRRALKQIDERLDLVLAKRNATVFPKPDRWYIVRFNEGAPVSMWMIEDEHGEYCEPDERHMERFRAGDSAAHPRLWDTFEKARLDRKLRAEKAVEDKSEEFRTKLGERLDHLFRPQIAVTSKHKEKLGDS